LHGQVCQFRILYAVNSFLIASKLLTQIVLLLRDSGVTAIENLMERRGKFDYILLETTGLADPGNIAPLFWLDEGLGSSIYLDSIVTLVDAANIITSLDDRTPLSIENTATATTAIPEQGLTTAHLQISHADVVVINKQDLVTPSQLETVKNRVRSINGIARIIVTQQGKVENLEEWLLDLKAYEKVEDLKTVQKSSLDPVFYIPYHSVIKRGRDVDFEIIDYINRINTSADDEPSTTRSVR
jgi:G3E family GTPase